MWWYYPWFFRRRRRNSLNDWVDTLSTPQRIALILTFTLSLPFLMVGTVLLIYQLFTLALNPSFWCAILAFIIWGACQKKK
jgi:hypothetical protein